MDTKKKLIILSVCVIVVILAICGIIGIVKSARGNSQNIGEMVEESYDPNVQEFLSSGDKTLVLFFSWGGHTEQLADAIAKKTRADSVIIDVEEEYPVEYEECYNVAQTQKNENARPVLKELGINLQEYNNIFIGYPIWLDDMPMPIYTLLENNDFSGKTVIPFMTSQSSGESGTTEKIRGILSSATVLDGFHISEETINNGDFDESVEIWVQSLDVKF